MVNLRRRRFHVAVHTSTRVLLERGTADTRREPLTSRLTTSRTHLDRRSRFCGKGSILKTRVGVRGPPYGLVMVGPDACGDIGRDRADATFRTDVG